MVGHWSPKPRIQVRALMALQLDQRYPRPSRRAGSKTSNEGSIPSRPATFSCLLLQFIPHDSCYRSRSNLNRIAQAISKCLLSQHHMGHHYPHISCHSRELWQLALHLTRRIKHCDRTRFNRIEYSESDRNTLHNSLHFHPTCLSQNLRHL